MGFKALVFLVFAGVSLAYAIAGIISGFVVFMMALFSTVIPLPFHLTIQESGWWSMWRAVGILMFFMVVGFFAYATTREKEKVYSR